MNLRSLWNSQGELRVTVGSKGVRLRRKISVGCSHHLKVTEGVTESAGIPQRWSEADKPGEPGTGSGTQGKAGDKEEKGKLRSTFLTNS